MLSIQLLGTPRVLLSGSSVSIPRRKSRALLFYLAAHAAPVTRDQALALLWADHDRASGQQILRTSLHGLRKALGAALLVSDDALALAADVDVDARSFEASLARPAASAEALAPIVALYRGEFLDGFSVPDSEAFGEWVDMVRERYRQLAVRGLVALASRYEAGNQYGPALEALARALAINPLQEDIQRSAMRLEYLSGDRAGAIRRYEQLRRLLDDELGVPPLDETRALYDAIIKDEVGRMKDEVSLLAQRSSPLVHPSSLSLHPSVLPFTGRDAEQQKLRDLLATHQLALIEGEPGIGKTRLAEAFISSFSGIVLAGAARELEQALPYQPVIEALRALLRQPEWPALRQTLDLAPVWRGEIARLLPELLDGAAPPAGPAPQLHGAESRLWEALNQLLLGLARRPVLLLIDDLHWADASTLALLGYLVRQSLSAPIAFLATSRPAAPRSPLAALLQTLTREGRLARIPLAPLSPDDLLALARHLSPAYSYPFAEWLSLNSEGNPYIVSELVRHAREQQLLLADGTINLAALSASPVVPQTIYSLVQSRLVGLSDAARRVLDVAVAVGREFELDLVGRAAGLSELALLDAIDELRAHRLIAPLDELRYRFDHSLTMEVAYREAGEARHRLIHRHVGDALEQLHQGQIDAFAGLIASHLAEGNAPERAASYAFLAGQRAAELSAWSEAIGFYQQALAGTNLAQRAKIQLALGTAYLQSGAIAPAAEAYRAALDLAKAQGDATSANQARLDLTGALIGQARYGEAIEIAKQVLAEGQPEQLVSAQLMWGTALSVEGVDLAGAAEHLRLAASFCAAEANPAHLAQITFELGSIAAQRGDLPAAIESYRRALAVAEQHPSAERYRILAHNNLAYHLLLLGDPSAIEHAKAGLSIARETGTLSFQPYLLSTLGEIALAAGDLAAAERYFTEGLDLAERLPVPERIAGLTANLGLVAIRQGQSGLAIHRLSTALAHADSLGTRHLAAQIRLWLAPLLPRAAALATLAEARAIAESGGRQRLLDEIAALEAQIS